MDKKLRLLSPIIFASVMVWIFIKVTATSAQTSLRINPETHITVTTLEDEIIDNGECSLREAIQAANLNTSVDTCSGGISGTLDQIIFNVEGVISLTQQLEVHYGGPLIIDAGDQISLSGNNKVRIISNDGDLTLNKITIMDGFDGGSGAGIANGGKLNINNSKIINNTVLNPCAFPPGGYGAGIANGGLLQVTNSLFSGNSVDCGSGGAIGNMGVAEINRSTFKNNRAAWDGGGIRNGGGDGDPAVPGYLSIINSTFTGNVGGGIGNVTGIVTITSTTFHNDGIFNAPPGSPLNPPAVTTLFNTIVSTNQTGFNCSGSIIDSGHNLDSGNSCGFNTTMGSLINTDPLLGELQDNGGRTETYSLLQGSPAIDHGDNSGCPSADQRGVHRPQDGDGDIVATCDIGSYEVYLDMPGKRIHFPVAFNHPYPLFCDEYFYQKYVWSGDLKWACDSTDKKEGTSSIKLTSAIPSDAEVYSPLIHVNPNQTYEVSYWIKTNLTVDTAQVYGRIIAAQYTGQAKEGDPIGYYRLDSGQLNGENVGGITEWTEKSYTFTTPPDTHFVRLRAMIGLIGTAQGEVWFDGVSIKEVNSAQSGSVLQVNK